MRLDDLGTDVDVEDQGRGGGGGFGGGGGIGFALLPFVFSRFGCGGVVVLGIALLVFGGLGNIGSMLS
ncbi:MAG: zinc metalloprotease, partial [Sphingomonadaceae bacterium]|nr:zinc metalloprotease [Sphingomonadaceae bacterium]